MIRSRLEKYRRPRFDVLTKQYNTKLPDNLAEDLEQICNELDMTPPEFIRLLIYEEVQALKGTRIPNGTEGYKKVPEDSKEYRPVTAARKTPKNQGGRAGSIQQWTINGQAPCPICGTWSSANNFKRDHADKHGYQSSYDLITSHKEKADQMAEERTKTAGF